jgi:cyclopropane-fatty-acyl-phospholipid synthase
VLLCYSRSIEERFASSLRNLFAFTVSLLSNRQSRRRACQVGETHYDLGNDFFQAMLDPWMQYSCALFEKGDDLAAAQRRKLEMICQRGAASTRAPASRCRLRLGRAS